MARYRYTLLNENGVHAPLESCPGCGADFLKDDSLILGCGNGHGTIWETNSELQARGILNDPLGDIAKGVHSFTMCATCHELLINFDGVDEEDDA